MRFLVCLLLAASFQVRCAGAQTPVTSSAVTYYSMLNVTATVTVSSLPDATFTRYGDPLDALKVYQDAQSYVTTQIPSGTPIHLRVTTTTELWQQTTTAGGVVTKALVSREGPAIKVGEWIKP